jgi:uncharacterized protein YbjT (DUF2867 family)
MEVTLLGATGFVGSALLKEALDRGHVVIAIVRHPEKLEKREGLTAKAGDLYDTASFATLIRGNEAIISAFNPGWKNPKFYDDQFRATASIIAGTDISAWTNARRSDAFETYAILRFFVLPHDRVPIHSAQSPVERKRNAKYNNWQYPW